MCVSKVKGIWFFLPFGHLGLYWEAFEVPCSSLCLSMMCVRPFRFTFLAIAASHYLAALFCLALEHVVLISAKGLLWDVSIYILGDLIPITLTLNFTRGKSVDFVELTPTRGQGRWGQDQACSRTLSKLCCSLLSGSPHALTSWC